MSHPLRRIAPISHLARHRAPRHDHGAADAAASEIHALDATGQVVYSSGWGKVTDDAGLIAKGVLTTKGSAGIPTSSTAGDTLWMSVTFVDTYTNVVTSYAGTVHFTSTDGRATVPGDTTYGAADAGAHVFLARLITKGTQSVTATDTVSTTINCSSNVVVQTGPPNYVIALPANANAAQPLSASLSVQDAFGNVVDDYAQTVHFTSSDTATGSVTPADVVFNGTQNGTASVNATFVSLGSQTLTGTEVGNAAVSGTGSTTCHGFVYTNPGAGGKARLVVNAASTTSFVQLDLVTGTRVDHVWGAGMNLPVDSARAAGDATLLAAGTALPAPIVSAAKHDLANNILYTALVRKRAAAVTPPIQLVDTNLNSGTTLFSIRLLLKGTATPGTIFDGATSLPQYRAAVKDVFGNDVVGQSEFAIGKLEVR